MDKTQRSILFLFSLPILGALFAYTAPYLQLESSIIAVIFSALFMLAFTSLFLEHYFTRPADVLSAAIAILLMLAPLKEDLGSLGIWYWIFLIYVLLQAITAMSALLLVDKNKSEQSFQNLWAHRLNKFSIHFGNGKLLFFGLFFLMLVFFISDKTNKEFLILSIFASVWLIIDPKKFFLSVFKKRKEAENDVGDIFGVQSKNTFLAKLYDDRIKIKRFDVVEFKYSSDHKIRRGLITDNYFLDESQWIKVLCSKDIQSFFNEFPTDQVRKENVLYKMDLETPVFLDEFVGIVVEGSTIQKVRFEYAQRVNIAEGSLINVNIGSQAVLYQVIQGTTESETLESKNETGFIVGEAIQLGVWNADTSTFLKYGWLPDINSPIYLAQDIDEATVSDNEFVIGNIPKTNYPSIINLDHAVTHHTAILGVTGSGKSVFARNLIRKIVRHGTKTIIIDLTNEYKDKLSDLSPRGIIDRQNQDTIFRAIQAISKEKEKFANQQDKNKIAQEETDIENSFVSAIGSFLQSDGTTALFDLPDLSNTTEIFDYTRWFFKALFKVAKDHNNYGNRVCVVLEEAHTIVPEWNFSGSSDKNSSALINSIAQIALQGRKYGIGFIVIGQRTANISKTVLTQCNSIIAFQQFDNTSTEFLSNFLGRDLASSLPSLEQRQAIATGKAFRANVPMIFEVPEITE